MAVPFALCGGNWEAMMREVGVNLGDRSYVITIGTGVLDTIGKAIASVRKPPLALVVSNPVVSRLYGEVVLSSIRGAGIRAELVIIPAGERFKTLGTVRRLYESMLEARLDRSGAVVALGGGVVGDLSGFAAATYMRGVDYYQVPTTLLAQVDSSIGGKTGADLPCGKNLVGAFHQPRAVVIDTSTLKTLPLRELRCGLAEVVKHGIIYDQEFYDFLASHARELLARRPEALAEAVGRSVEIKRDVVEQDERESGVRAILNYGHTVGHAIEALSGYRKYRHGEAISIGMVTEAILAENEGVAAGGTARAVADVLNLYRLPVDWDDELAPDDVLKAMELDKKVMGGDLRLALPTRIGECKVFKIERGAVRRAIESHASLASTLLT